MRVAQIIVQALIIILIFSVQSCKNSRISDINRFDVFTSARIDSLMHTFAELDNIAGFAVGIVNKNEIVYTKSVGVKSIKSKEPITPLSIFNVASVSKPFTATAIMQLVEQNKIDLDSTISFYLPYFKLADERYDLITIRQILNHTAGFPWIENYEYENPQFDDGAAEIYILSLSNITLISNPGEKFNYTDMGYNILADIIQKITGITFEEYVHNNILKPLNMNESSFLKSNINPKLITSPHVLMENSGKQYLSISKVYPYNRIHAPSSTLHSNVLDMCNWLLVCLNKGEYNGIKILDSSNYELMIKEQLGWFWSHDDLHSNTFVNHGGADIGYRSFICYVPELSMGVVVLVNSDTINANRIGYKTLWILDEISKMD